MSITINDLSVGATQCSSILYQRMVGYIQPLSREIIALHEMRCERAEGHSGKHGRRTPDGIVTWTD